ncbi:hypothetical protein DPMN_058447 [Dreissena polymorpha]|uniref:Uncharacterized protein n=2 Tax=Dreissena polymorpha TaxID=45954 RepID=A0A9D4C214_DREPO|nr:hypothetical protein DPMN_058447 [Dreissena polymorpha]
MAVPVIEEDGEDFKILGKHPIRVYPSDNDVLDVGDKHLCGPYSEPSAGVVNVDDGPKILAKSLDSSTKQQVQATHNQVAIKKPTKRIGRYGRKLRTCIKPLFTGRGSFLTGKTRKNKKPDIRHLIEKGTYWKGKFYKLVPVSHVMEKHTSRNICQPQRLHMKPAQAVSSAEDLTNYSQPLDLSFNKVQTSSATCSTCYDQAVDMSIKGRPLDQQNVIKLEMSEPSHPSNESHIGGDNSETLECVRPDELMDTRQCPRASNESDMGDSDSVTHECVGPDELMETGQCPGTSSSCSPAFKQMNIGRSDSNARQGVIHTQDFISLLKEPDKLQALTDKLQQSGLHAMQLQALIQQIHRSSHHGHGPHENNPELKVIDADEPIVPRILHRIPDSPAVSHVSAQQTGSLFAVASTQAYLHAKAAMQVRTAQAAPSVAMISPHSKLAWISEQMQADLAQAIPSPVVIATAPIHVTEAHSITAARALAFHDEIPLPQMPNLMALEQTDQNGVLVPNKFESGQRALKSFLNKKDKNPLPLGYVV